MWQKFKLWMGANSQECANVLMAMGLGALLLMVCVPTGTMTTIFGILTVVGLVVGALIFKEKP